MAAGGADAGEAAAAVEEGVGGEAGQRRRGRAAAVGFELGSWGRVGGEGYSDQVTRLDIGLVFARTDMAKQAEQSAPLSTKAEGGCPNHLAARRRRLGHRHIHRLEPLPPAVVVVQGAAQKGGDLGRVKLLEEGGLWGGGGLRGGVNAWCVKMCEEAHLSTAHAVCVM